MRPTIRASPSTSFSQEPNHGPLTHLEDVHLSLSLPAVLLHDLCVLLE